MGRVAFVQLDLGGSLDHTMVDLTSDGARWDADPLPSVTLRSGSGGEIRAAVTATAGPATSTASAVAAGAKRVPVLATTDFLRWEEVVVGPNSSGQWEWATIDGISLSEALTVLDELSFAYGSGVPVKSHRLSTTLTAADVGDVQRRAWAEWSYEVGGVARKEATIYVASRYAPRLSLTATELLGEDPRVRRLIAGNQRLDLLIRRTWERKVLPAIAAMWAPGALISGESAEEALILAVRLKLARDAKDFESADKIEALYRTALDRLQSVPVDLDEGGEADDAVRGAVAPRLLRG
jgi:hypothetical protein